MSSRLPQCSSAFETAFLIYVFTNHCSKTTGQYHSLKGTVVEAIGNLTGSESWSKSGRDEHAQGEAEYNAAQAKGYAEGAVDRLTGKKDAVVGAVTGDRQQETAGERTFSPFFCVGLCANVL